MDDFDSKVQCEEVYLGEDEDPEPWVIAVPEDC